jgi:hypothetical protein
MLSGAWLIISTLLAIWLIPRDRWEGFGADGALNFAGSAYDPTHVLVAAAIALLPPLFLFVAWWLALRRM